MKQTTTRLKYLLWTSAFAMLVFTCLAQAATPVKCAFTPVPTAFATAYASATNVTYGSFTVTCSNAGTATYYVSAIGTNLPVFRAVSGANFITYNLYQADCATPWNNTSSYFSASVTSPTSTNFTYCVSIPANQTVAAGTYTDTINLAFTATSSASPGNPASFNGTASIGVSIVAPASCTLAAPGNITINYASFNPSAVLANTSFAPTCTNLLPYTMALDVTSGTIAGVTYTLGLSTLANDPAVGTSPLTSRGIGVAQTFYINASAAANQIGTCTAATCSGSNTHTLTVSY